MNKTSAIAFQGLSRVHIALEVADLERSIAFYRVLFAAEPVKIRAGYAKFEPADPSVNLSLNEGVGGPLGRRGGEQHFGVQVQSTEAVEAMTERFRSAGIATRLEEETACCYAVQSKVWVEDPDGNPWEVFVVTQAESSQRTPTSSTCCVPASVGVAESACCVPGEPSRAGGSSCC
ncbi:MAG TPA: ArsI/CadI family heavy metal resistance metalloenzyme [Planctomycetota bacterium]|nr:ArsI/CadI family heavy metal resistance metalloenzyme [Planctomycetota bacterium]